MERQLFTKWLDSLKEIWQTKNPQKIMHICSEKFVWHETPFDTPLTTQEQLVNEWKSILDQDNIQVSYTVLCIKENMCVAQWHATFTRLPSKEPVELDGIFQITLDKKGKCIEFRQWYNAKKQL
jgi:hypothetical protein